METIYNVDYFLAKFQAIPENKWTINTRADGNGKRCALGWCYLTDSDASRSMESGDGTYSAEDNALCALFSVLPYPWVGGTNNGVEECPYKQDTPKKRILAALADIKAKQQPAEPKEKIIYKTVVIDTAVQKLQKQLTEN